MDASRTILVTEVPPTTPSQVYQLIEKLSRASGMVGGEKGSTEHFSGNMYIRTKSDMHCHHAIQQYIAFDARSLREVFRYLRV